MKDETVNQDNDKTEKKTRGSELREHMRIARLTSSALAQRTGFNRSLIYRFTIGQKPSPEQTRLLEQALKRP